MALTKIPSTLLDTTSGLSLSGDITLADNDKAIFGAGSDLQIYHDGSNSYVKDAGTGDLYIQGTQLRLQSATGESFFVGVANGAAYVYHNGSAKLNTTATGIDVTGNITVSGTVDGRDIATDGTKLDTVETNADVTDTTNVTAAGALMDSEITNLAQVKAFDSSDYATAAQGSTADSALQNIVEDTSPQLGGTLDTNNQLIQFGDSSGSTVNRLSFGASSDLQIWHSGLGSYISDTGAGSLSIRGTHLNLADSGGNIFIEMTDTGTGGTVEIKHEAVTKLTTSSTGIDITGNITVSGTVDGRDLATDGTKLDGIEANATADQTQSDINALAITEVGTISTGTWQGTAIASAYLDSDTAHLSGAQTFTGVKTFASPVINTGISGTAILDEDNMASNSATQLATQQSIKAYVDAEVAGVVDSAPAALDTLNELAAALGDDANFSTTTSTALGNRLRVDTAAQGLTGTQQANAITNLGITATKAELNYVDGVTSAIQTQLDGKQATGSYLTGNQTITLSGDVSGSGTTSIAVTVADDSHNHVISNVDGLQTALDGKAPSSTTTTANAALPKAGGALTGAVTTNSTFDGRNVSVDGAKLDTIATNANNYSFPYTVSSAAGNSTVVQRDGNGYIFSNYFNGTGTFSTSGATSGMGRFTGTNGTDTYGRSYTAAAARTLLNVENGATADQTAAEILTAIKTVDGAGSGLDADLLDGISSGSFLRSDTSDSMTGELNVTHNGGITGSTAPQYSNVNIELQTSSNHVPGISFHRGGYSATTLYEYDGELYTNPWTTRAQTGKLVSSGNIGTYAWTSSNDGSGSGLDADTVDGIQGGSFLRSDAADTCSGQIDFTAGMKLDGHVIFNGGDTWFRSLAATGWYSASYGGGIHMQDTTWVRIYNSKALYVANQIAATGNITAYYSDERLKTKTGKIENALEKVQSLSGFTYVENELARSLGYVNENEQVALSAQDVKKVMPQAVSLAPCDMKTDELTGVITSKSGEDYLTIDYARLVPLLVEAIKEQQETIEELKNGFSK
jgi:hypothetical protein